MRVVCDRMRRRSVVLILVLLDVASFFFHFLLFYYAVHVVVDGQVLEFSGVLLLVEDHLELVLHGVGAAVLLARRYRWRRKQWVHRDSLLKFQKIKLIK